MKAGATLDYDTATSYTLTITATDGGTPTMTSEAKTITIGLIENVEAVYSISENDAGTMLTAMLDTADPEGVQQGSVPMFQWFTTDGTTKTLIGTPSTTNTLDITGRTLQSGETYGVEVTYTDGAGIDESVDVLNSSIAFTSPNGRQLKQSEIDDLWNEGDDFRVVTLATDIVGSGEASYARTGGADMNFFIIVGGNELYILTGDFNFPTTQSSLEVEITATDSVTDDIAIQTYTLTVNQGTAVYSISESGDTLTADLDTADSDGVEAGSTMYRWFTTIDAGANRNYLGTASTSNTLDTSISGNELPQNAVYGVEITYTDGLGFDESVDARQSTIAFSAFIISARTPSIDGTRVTSAINNDNDLIISQALSNAVSIVGSGMASFSITGGADMDHFTIAGSRNNLNLLTSADNFPTTQTSFVVEITATNSANADTAVLTFTVRIFGSVGSASPAQIPERQAMAHDPYDPDELGLTPMPDADPNAG